MELSKKGACCVDKKNNLFFPRMLIRIVAFREDVSVLQREVLRLQVSQLIKEYSVLPPSPDKPFIS